MSRCQWAAITWSDLVWDHHTSVAALGEAFRSRAIPALQAALKHHDAERAFADAAHACNDCPAAGMKFLEISTRLGATVPMIEH